MKLSEIKKFQSIKVLLNNFEYYQGYVFAIDENHDEIQIDDYDRGRGTIAIWCIACLHAEVGPDEFVEVELD